MSTRPHSWLAPAFAVAAFLFACGPVADREEAAAPEEPPGTWFAEITAESGLDFRHGAGRNEEYLASEIMGSGGALFDHDGDGDLDLYLVDAGVAGGSPNRMLARQPDGTFADVTEASGLGDPGYGMGTALGDVDNDGDLDLLVTNLGPDVLYLNTGGGVFRPGPVLTGSEGWSTSACFFDYDLDGRLDLYVASYLDFDPPKACTDSAGNPEFCGPEAFRGVPDRLYRGHGDGTFTDVTATALSGQPASKGLGVICADFNGDSAVDVYVTNDGEPNQLWIRGSAAETAADQRAVFEDHALMLGAALNAFGRPEASMGVAAADVDGDLDLDLFMTHLDRETNTLYLNLGDGGWQDGTATSGLGAAGLPFTGFGTAFVDLDHDGDLDLAVVNGRVRRGASLVERAERRRGIDEGLPPLLAEYAEPNLLFVNDGAGTFRDLGALAGRLADAVDVSRGLLAGDVDGDGDLDLVLTSCGGPVRLLRNDAPRAHWLAVRAIDPELRRDALGAAVIVHAGGRTQLRPVISAFSYLSAVEPEIHFGLDGAQRYDGITVVWPDGTREGFPGGTADRRIRLLKGEGEREP
jgi:hypothetical protein